MHILIKGYNINNLIRHSNVFLKSDSYSYLVLIFCPISGLIWGVGREEEIGHLKLGGEGEQSIIKIFKLILITFYIQLTLIFREKNC